MNVLKFSSALTLTSLLAACASSPLPITDTKPAPIAILPVAIQPAWAATLVTGNFACDMGNRVDVKFEDKSSESMTLIWKGSSYKMTSVSTSTGALRFENKGDGLVWIQIPAKSMLLNAKIGQQLANECKVR